MRGQAGGVCVCLCVWGEGGWRVSSSWVMAGSSGWCSLEQIGVAHVLTKTRCGVKYGGKNAKKKQQKSVKKDTSKPLGEYQTPSRS